MNLFAHDCKSETLNESSRSGLVYAYIKRNCKAYRGFHHYSDITLGECKGDRRSKVVSALTFHDNSFDLIIASGA